MINGEKCIYEEMTYKKAETKDVTQIIELIKMCYGMSCSDSLMYNEEVLKQRMERKDFAVYVAVNREDKVIAMENYCRREEFPCSLYLKNKMTHSEYRSCGIGLKLTEYLMKTENFSIWNSLYAYCLTYNSFSQANLIHFGFSVTGFVYNSFLKNEQIKEAADYPKRSHVIMVKNMGVKAVGTLYIPREINKAAELIYQQLGVAYCVDNKQREPVGTTSLSNEYSQVHHNLETWITHPGTDMIQIISHILEGHEKDLLFTHQIYLNIKDESAIWAYEKLKSIGYILSGIKPLEDECEYFVLYGSTHQKPVPEALSVHEKFQKTQSVFSTFAKKSEVRDETGIR